MKLLIASDIHGDAVCCQALLDAYKRENAEKILLLGDILYHGPRNDLPSGYAPKSVIEMLNALADKLVCVRGNCEAEVDQMVLSFPVMSTTVCVLDSFNNRAIYMSHGHIYSPDAERLSLPLGTHPRAFRRGEEWHHMRKPRVCQPA